MALKKQSHCLLDHSYQITFSSRVFGEGFQGKLYLTCFPTREELKCKEEQPLTCSNTKDVLQNVLECARDG